MKLLDTTVAIDHLRGEPAAVAILRELIEEGESIVASEIVRFELLVGVRPDEFDALEEFFSALAWVPIDEGVTRVAGSVARKYRKTHSGIDDVDYLIAGTTIVLDADLLTTNVRHFPMLAGLRSAY